MPVTTLDVKTALVVIDIQKGILGYRFAHPATDILDNVVRLVGAFRANGRPVVLVRVGSLCVPKPRIVRVYRRPRPDLAHS